MFSFLIEIMFFFFIKSKHQQTDDGRATQSVPPVSINGPVTVRYVRPLVVDNRVVQRTKIWEVSMYNNVANLKEVGRSKKKK